MKEATIRNKGKENKALSFFKKIINSFRHYLKIDTLKSIYNESKEIGGKKGLYRQIVFIISFIPVCSGPLLMGELELGIIFPLLFAALSTVFGYVISLQAGGLLGLSTINFIVIIIVFMLVLAIIYITSIKKTMNDIDYKNNEIEYNRSYIAMFLISFGKGIARYFKDFNHQYKISDAKGKIALGLGWFVMGIPLTIFKNMTKGIALFAVQLFAILYFIARGFADLQNLFILNTKQGMRGYLIYGVIAIAVLALLVIFYFINLKATLNQVKRDNLNKTSPRLRKQVTNLIDSEFYVSALIIPVLGALVFTVIPLLFMIVIAFTNYSLVTSPGYSSTGGGDFLQWIGMDTFERIFLKQAGLLDFFSVFAWTMIWALLATFTCYFGGLLLALLLNKKCIKAKVVWRSLFVVSMALPQFVSLLVMKSMFMDQGPINTLLKEWGWISETISFWKDDFLSKFLIIMINMWVGVPYYMLLMSGLLINIPKDYYEAASIEGATSGQQFRKITLPNILFMTTPTLISSFVSNINNFNVIWFLTAGEPAKGEAGSTAGNTDILITWLYKLTMRKSDFNYGSAIGIIMFIITATVSLLVFRKSKSYNNEETYQ